MSSSSAEQPLASRLSEFLAAAGHQVSRLEADLAGSRIGETTTAAIGSADAVVVLLGRSALSQQWTVMEVAAALASEKPVVPVLTDPDAEMPFLLRDRRYVDLSRPEVEDSGLSQLERALTTPAVYDEARPGRTAVVTSALDSMHSRAERYELDEARRRSTLAVWAAVRAIVAVLASLSALGLASQGSTVVAAAIAGGAIAIAGGAAGQAIATLAAVRRRDERNPRSRFEGGDRA